MLDFMGGHGNKYENESVIDVMDEIDDLFQGVASDLGVDDPSADGFVDYARDTMSDAGVPREMIDHVAEWCRCGCPRPAHK
jgi:hypothetical protein